MNGRDWLLTRVAEEMSKRRATDIEVSRSGLTPEEAIRLVRVNTTLAADHVAETTIAVAVNQAALDDHERWR